MYKYLTILLCLMFCQNAFCEEISGVVIDVHDGDTATVQNQNKKFKIRFEHIDCPELKQEGGWVAKNFLSSIILNKIVTVQTKSNDRYGRTIGTVEYEDKNVNKALVAAGLCWWYPKYSKDSSYSTLQKEAMNNKLGIWRSLSPMPPWDFRELQRNKK